jgi:hypothetical protein
MFTAQQNDVHLAMSQTQALRHIRPAYLCV